MKKTINLATILWLLFAVKASAQIEILDTKKLDKVKQGQTYIFVKSTNFPGADKFLQAMQKDWTLSNGIHYLSLENETITLQPNDSFLALQSVTTTSNYGRSIIYNLSFWTCKESFYKKQRERMRQSDHETIANVALSIDNRAFDTAGFFEENDFDGGGLILNWSPGMVHNYLQQINTLLNNKQKRKLTDGVKNEAELANLKDAILYVPDCDLISAGIFGAKRVIRGEEATNDIFADYKYAYKVLKKEELDNLIFTSSKPVYYLLFIRNFASKIVCIINGKTGESIYVDHSQLSFQLKPGDLRSIYKLAVKN